MSHISILIKSIVFSYYAIENLIMYLYFLKLVKFIKNKKR